MVSAREIACTYAVIEAKERISGKRLQPLEPQGFDTLINKFLYLTKRSGSGFDKRDIRSCEYG